MKIPFFDLSRQYLSLQEKVEREVLNVMRSGQYIEGNAVKEFEERMSNYLNVKHVITCGNGTDSIRIALQSVGVENGDEVITTSFSFFATAEAIAEIGATPVFADILPDTFNIDPNDVEKRITPKTKAILIVHIFGMPADMDELNIIAEKYNIPIIEDACQAIGASYKDKKTGTLGKLGCFSFYPTKNLGGYGDGGMITTNDDKIAEICRAIKSHAAGKNGAIAYSNLFGKDILEIKEESFDQDNKLYDPYKYYNYFIGCNSRLDSIQAAILNVKLEYIDTYNDKRRKIAEMYVNGLEGTAIKTPRVKFEDRISCFHQFAVLVNHKEGFIKYLAEYDIGAGNFYPVPLHKQKAFKDLMTDEMRVSEDCCNKTVCLPIYPELTNEEVEYIINICRQYDDM